VRLSICLKSTLRYSVYLSDRQTLTVDVQIADSATSDITPRHTPDYHSQNKLKVNFLILTVVANAISPAVLSYTPPESSLKEFIPARDRAFFADPA
jgi:hypothetical protein